MKNKAYRSYNFNFKYEYKTYKNIGVEDKILYETKKNVFYRLRWGIRQLYNWDEKKYKNLNKYSEWEKYFSTKYSKGYNNDSNFIHYLIDGHRNHQLEKEICKSLMIPLFVMAVTLTITIYSTMGYSVGILILVLLISIVVIELPCVVSFVGNQNKENFYKDCIEVMNKLLASHQN